MSFPRVFRAYRTEDISDTHDENQVNPPDQVQYEGVVFSDGRCAIRWLTNKQSTSVWDSFDDMFAVHGHPEYGTVIEWEKGSEDKYYAIYSHRISEIVGITNDESVIEDELKNGNSAVEISKIKFYSYGDDLNQWRTAKELYTIEKHCKKCGNKEKIVPLKILPDMTGLYSSELDFCTKCEESW